MLDTAEGEERVAKSKKAAELIRSAAAAIGRDEPMEVASRLLKEADRLVGGKGTL
jgi:hypothetical protein